MTPERKVETERRGPGWSDQTDARKIASQGSNSNREVSQRIPIVMNQTHGPRSRSDFGK